MVVSDTVRLRRARTPSNPATPQGGDPSSAGRDRAVTTSRAMNLPDLLPSTFRLAEQSSLFSNFNEAAAAVDSVTRQANENYQNGKSYAVSTPQVSQITLEKVQYFEPEHAETVNIVDLSEDNASDTSEGCSTPKRSRENLHGSSPLIKNGHHPKGDVKKVAHTERINSFYEESDKDQGHEEPLVFSEDEDEFEANLVH